MLNSIRNIKFIKMREFTMFITAACVLPLVKMKDYMDRRVTPHKQVTSPTWGSPPPCKQALR